MFFFFFISNIRISLITDLAKINNRTFITVKETINCTPKTDVSRFGVKFPQSDLEGVNVSLVMSDVNSQRLMSTFRATSPRADTFVIKQSANPTCDS